MLTHLKKLSKVINISFISADSRGFEITKKELMTWDLK